MSTSSLSLGLENLRSNWKWLLALGLAQIVLGIVALFMMPVATLAAVLVLGWLMVISGVAEAVHAFQVRGWSGFLLHVIGGLLGICVGLLIVTHPIAGALVWTLLFAALFTVFGVARIVGAATLKFPNWGWAVFDGAVTLGLGILLWAGWPFSGLWFLGLSLGVSLTLRGWSYAVFAFALRSQPALGDLRRVA